MANVIIYSRKAITVDVLIGELVAHVLQSSVWTAEERKDLGDTLDTAIADWMDAAIAKGDA